MFDITIIPSDCKMSESTENLWNVQLFLYFQMEKKKNYADCTVCSKRRLPVISAYGEFRKMLSSVSKNHTNKD